MAPAHAQNIAWLADPRELSKVADFLAAIVALDDSYVSHGEIQTGLSEDGRTWAPDLQARFREDLADLGEERSVAIARDADGRLAAAAIVAWTETERVSFATLEDIAVAPAARGTGIARAMVAFIEAEARARAMAWVFLESGLENHRAHEFFERAGYAPISKVFLKRL